MKRKRARLVNANWSNRINRKLIPEGKRLWSSRYFGYGLATPDGPFYVTEPNRSTGGTEIKIRHIEEYARSLAVLREDEALEEPIPMLGDLAEEKNLRGLIKLGIPESEAEELIAGWHKIAARARDYEDKKSEEERPAREAARAAEQAEKERKKAARAAHKAVTMQPVNNPPVSPQVLDTELAPIDIRTATLKLLQSAGQ